MKAEGSIIMIMMMTMMMTMVMCFEEKFVDGKPKK